MTRCLHPAFEGMREEDFRQEFFDAWCEGRTGYPLVDACLRSLHANGWITFRMRFLSIDCVTCRYVAARVAIAR